ncbi:hypothetical protein BHE74_00045069, partial [Ensete ventricosum]
PTGVGWTKSSLKLVATESPLELVVTESPLELIRRTESLLELVGTKSTLELVEPLDRNPAYRSSCQVDSLGATPAGKSATRKACRLPPAGAAPSHSQSVEGRRPWRCRPRERSRA